MQSTRDRVASRTAYACSVVRAFLLHFYLVRRILDSGVISYDHFSCVRLLGDVGVCSLHGFEDATLRHVKVFDRDLLTRGAVPSVNKLENTEESIQTSHAFRDEKKSFYQSCRKHENCRCTVQLIITKQFRQCELY